MSIEQKRRAAFEAAIKEKWPDAPTHWVRDLLPKDDPRYGEYVSTDLRAAWIGFNIALDSVVIELPPTHQPAIEDDRRWHSIRNQTITACLRAIESAGLKVK